MKVAQIKVRMSKNDMVFAIKKLKKLVDNLPDGQGDLRDYFWVTLSSYEHERYDPKARISAEEY